MAQTQYIQILDDNEILSASPLIVVDTDFYELWYQQSGFSNWTQAVFNSPLPMVTFTVSPWNIAPCITVTPLPDATTFNYQIRRIDHNGNMSTWVTGTFTTL